VITCKHCNVEKSESEMLQRRGKPSKVCLECFGKKMSKDSGGGRPRKKESPL